MANRLPEGPPVSILLAERLFGRGRRRLRRARCNLALPGRARVDPAFQDRNLTLIKLPPERHDGLYFAGQMPIERALCSLARNDGRTGFLAALERCRARAEIEQRHLLGGAMAGETAFGQDGRNVTSEGRRGDLLARG